MGRVPHPNPSDLPTPGTSETLYRSSLQNAANAAPAPSKHALGGAVPDPAVATAHALIAIAAALDPAPIELVVKQVEAETPDPPWIARLEDHLALGRAAEGLDYAVGRLESATREVGALRLLADLYEHHSIQQIDAPSDTIRERALWARAGELTAGLRHAKSGHAEDQDGRQDSEASASRGTDAAFASANDGDGRAPSSSGGSYPKGV